jgi:GntR family transcriptional regulator
MADPMYWTIAQYLREQVESGELRPGDQLPTELELRQKYNASRNTIRDAVKWLATRGLIQTRPGQGTFVAPRFKPFVTTLSADLDSGLGGGEGDGAFAEVRERGLTPEATVPRVEVLVAPGYISDRLRIAEGTQVITRRQERYINRMPWSLQTTAYPMELVRKGAVDLLMAQDIPGGAVAYLTRTLGIEEIGHRDRILVRAPGEDEARFFKLPDDGRVSVVSVIRTGYRDSEDGPVPFRVTFTAFPADRNQFVINAGTSPKELAGAASDQYYTAPTDSSDEADKPPESGNRAAWPDDQPKDSSTG